MNVTNDGVKDRQLHIEDYLQMVSAEQKEYAEVSDHQRITERNDTITDFQTDKRMEESFSAGNRTGANSYLRETVFRRQLRISSKQKGTRCTKEVSDKRK